MSDRELLELAAKAAGYNYKPQNGAIVVDGIPANWNPLTDDGDALRLVVKLQMELTVFRDHVTAFYATGWCDELNGDDPYAATSRAIVRAAAEIGRAMP